MFSVIAAGAAITASTFPSGQMPSVSLSPASLQLAEAEESSEENPADVEDEGKVKAREVAEAYKHLKKVQYDGITEKELFPLVIALHKDAISTLDNYSLDADEQTRIRSILLDLDPLLIQGSIHYSGEDNREEMNRFATACVDTRMRPDMSSYPFSRTSASVYPLIVYCAGSDAYNSKNLSKAIGYFEEYLKTGSTDHKEQICLAMGQAAIIEKTPERVLPHLIEASALYPSNYDLLVITLQNCVDANDNKNMQPLLDRALLMRPNDERLLNLQADLYEKQHNYSAALELYSKLYELHPTNLAINRHMAICYYNMGSDYYNKAILEQDEKTAKKNMRQSKAYFSSASSKLGAVVDSDPTDIKYLKALAMTYACLGETTKLQEINTRLTALGSTPVVINGMPESITYNDADPGMASTEKNIPDFQTFARNYVESNLAEWSKRSEFEKKEDFEKRITQANIDAEYARLCRQAEEDYIRQYAGNIRINEMSLEPYDIDNESYLINSDVGQIIVHVPLKNKEAEAFKSGWNGIQLRNLKYYIKDNNIAIASVDLVTPTGKKYSYNAENAINYDFTEVQVDVSSFLAQARQTGSPSSSQTSPQAKSQDRVLRAKSDVDKDIPVTSQKASNTIAVIWANENYANVSPVQSAINDGEVFAEYCVKTLGIPQSQVYLSQDVTYGQMVNSLSNLRKHVDALGNNVNIIFYYAGHGIPDEKTKDAFLIPSDGVGTNTESMYPMKKLYKTLSDTGAEHVMLFFDACFSGATRNQDMVVQARAVAIKPQETAPEGSMFVLSATSGDETALPYKEKNHGMFTYYLLKKLQDSKGNVTLKELSDYVSDQVKKNSMAVNRKSQSPSVKVSGQMADLWHKKKLRP